MAHKARITYLDRITGWTGWEGSCLSSRQSPYLALHVDLPFAEVQNQADFVARGNQVVDQLHLVGFDHPAHRFQLENHNVFNEDVGNEVTDDFTLVVDLDRLL